MALSRAALGFAAALTVAALVWHPFPPSTPHEWGSFTMFATLLVAEVIALAWPRGLAARIIVYGLGALGALATVLHTVMLVAERQSDTPVGFVVVVLALGLALVAAAIFRLRAPPARPAVSR